MIRLLIYLLPVLGLFGPSLWVQSTIKRNDRELPDMPFTGLEFGHKILAENDLEEVEIESVPEGDHYDPQVKKVLIVEDRLNRKSISSIAIVCHEIGHAIQDKENYRPLAWRQNLVKKTQTFQKIGSAVLVIGLPSVFAITNSPVLTLIAAFLALGCLATNTLIHLVTLPVEFDASFKRALPILENYVPKENLPQCRSVLRAAALTYVAASIVSIFRLRTIFLIFITLFRAVVLKR